MKENNVGLDEAVALWAANASRHIGAGDVLTHQVLRKGRLALDASLVRKTPVCLNNEVSRDTGGAFQTVDVLSKKLVQEALLCEQANEDV